MRLTKDQLRMLQSVYCINDKVSGWCDVDGWRVYLDARGQPSRRIVGQGGAWYHVDSVFVLNVVPLKDGSVVVSTWHGDKKLPDHGMNPSNFQHVVEAVVGFFQYVANHIEEQPK